jgi:concanavalin A-like lectin/glucanase superfamily protein
MADRPNYSEELSGAPLADLIHAVALAVADGQFQMDKASLRAAEFMSGAALLRDMDSGQLLAPDGQPSDLPRLVDTRVYFGYGYDEEGKRVANRLSMMELGFVPTFYQFVDTVIDVKLTLRLHRESAESGGLQGTAATEGRSPRSKAKTVITTTPVDARYSRSYNFSAEMTSKVKTKLVPIPPPPVLEERIRALLDEERLDRQRRAGEAAGQEQRSLSRQPLGGPEFTGQDFFEIGNAMLAKALASAVFTIEAWVSAKAQTGDHGIVGAWMGKEAEKSGWLLGFFGGEFGIALTTRGAGQATTVKTRSPAIFDRWQHLAAVYDGAEIRLYLDGQLRNGSTAQSGEIAYADKARMLIGAHESPAGLERFAGRIDDVRLWNRPRTASEIKDTMNYRLQGDEPGLVAYWRLDRYNDNEVPDAKGQHPARRAGD